MKTIRCAVPVLLAGALALAGCEGAGNKQIGGTVLGGIGTLWGGTLGAFLNVMLADYLASSGFHGIDLITGAVFVLVVLLFRRGIWGTVRNRWLARQLRRTSSRRGSADADG